MDHFSNEVCEKLKSYVYRLIDPRNGHTFYVGKGKGNRVFAHVSCALDHFEDGINYLEKDEDAVSTKIATIREIASSGLQVIHVIHRWGLDDKTAFEVEAALIDAFPGLSNIQSGHGDDRGSSNCEELEKELSLKTYEEPKDFKYMIIKIHQSRIDYLLEQGTNLKDARYEATRYYWKIKPKSIKEYPYVLSVTNGVVYDVFQVEKWIYHEEYGRYEFVGKQAPKEILERFKNKRIPEYYTGKGKANPCLYSKN